MEATKEAVKESTDEVSEEAAPVAVAIPTREELKGKGWTAKELDNAEKRGMIGKVEEKKDEKVVEAAAVVEKKADVKEAKPNGSLPDFTATPEQEKVFLDTFGNGTPQRAMYFGMKNERQKRQIAEARAKELEARISALELPKPRPVFETDESGNQIDPEDKPLTLKALRSLQESERAAYEAKQNEAGNRQRVVTSAQTEQEEYARSVYPDFDTTVNKAKEVMTNLDALVPEKWKQAKVVKLIRELQVAAANADQFGLDEYHAAQIANEIGQLHPSYGKADGEKPTTGLDPKAGGLSPDQMKRIEANTQRRSSSASAPSGGGKRVVAADEVDLSTFNKFDFAKRSAFRKNHPEAYARLLRG